MYMRVVGGGGYINIYLGEGSSSSSSSCRLRIVTSLAIAIFIFIFIRSIRLDLHGFYLSASCPAAELVRLHQPLHLRVQSGKLCRSSEHACKHGRLHVEGRCRRQLIILWLYTTWVDIAAFTQRIAAFTQKI